MQTRFGTTTAGLNRRKIFQLARRRLFQRIKSLFISCAKNITSKSFWLSDVSPSHMWPVITGLLVSLCVFSGLAVFSWHRNAYMTETLRFVDMSIDGAKVSVATHADTPGELLASLGVEMREGDSLNMDESAALHSGDTVFLRRAMTVFIMDNHEGDLVSMKVAGGTVADAVSLDRNTRTQTLNGIVQPDLNAPLVSGMVIEVDNVSKEIVTITEEIPYRTVRQNDSTLLVGREQVETEGAAGERQVTEQIVYVNGEEASRSIISQIVIKEAVDKVIKVGTKPAATPKPSTARKTSTPKPSSTSKKTNATGSVDSSSNTITVGGKTYTIAQTLSMELTAYTHTGNKTATGKWPTVGMVAINRSEFSYGTKFYIPGYGIAVAEDTGVRGTNRIDVFMDTYDECITWGRKRNYTVYVLE